MSLATKRTITITPAAPNEAMPILLGIKDKVTLHFEDLDSAIKCDVTILLNDGTTMTLAELAKYKKMKAFL